VSKVWGNSIWSAGCVALFIIGLLIGSVATSAFAVILFLLGVILKFLIIRDKEGIKK
jgi:hypothetical protein